MKLQSDTLIDPLEMLDRSSSSHVAYRKSLLTANELFVNIKHNSYVLRAIQEKIYKPQVTMMTSLRSKTDYDESD